MGLRKTGWMLAAIGLGAPAIILPIFAWLARHSDHVFNKYASWASILSMTAGAVGVIIVILDRVGKLGDLSPERLAAIADELSIEVFKQEQYLLAQLLGTDMLDNRPAQTHFLPSHSSRSRSKKKQAQEKSKKLEEIAEFYLTKTRGRMVVLGDPGTGKTVLAARLTVDLIKDRNRLDGPVKRLQEKPIPVLLNLSSWDARNAGFADWLQLQVGKRFRLGKAISLRLVEDGRILPILDGLDEMDSSETAPRRSMHAITAVNNYIASTPDARVVIVSRSGLKYYERLARKIRDAVEVTVQNLKVAQIIDYLKVQCQDEQDFRAWQPVFNSLHGPDSREVRAALGTPWRLTAAVAFYRDGGNPGVLLPSHDERTRSGSTRGRQGEYSDRIMTLLMEAFVITKIRLHQNGRFRPAASIQWLRNIADRLTDMEKVDGRGNEIVPHEWWKAFDSRKILLTHGFLTWSVLHIPFAVIGYFDLGSSIEIRKSGLFTAVAVFSNYATIMMFSLRRTFRDKSPTTLRLRSLRTPARAAVAAFGVSISLCLSLLTITYNVALGAGIGVSMATMSILISASSGLSSTDAARPVDPLRNDRNFACVIGLNIASYTALYYVDLYGPMVALTFASMTALGTLFSSTYMRYIVAVVYGNTKGLPLSFGRFLEWCHSAGILRISGAGYQFRHQELRDYLRLR